MTKDQLKTEDVMENRLERELRLLTGYALFATLVSAFFIVSAFTLQARQQKFDDVQRN